MKVEDVPQEWLAAVFGADTRHAVSIGEVASAQLAAVAPLIQQAERERCARVVQRWEGHDPKLVDSIASAIRATPPDTGPAATRNAAHPGTSASPRPK